MMEQINRRVITPLLLDLGARYLVKPFIRTYDDEEKTAEWAFGYKKHGDKRMRTTVYYQGITYADGEKREGKAYQRVEDSYSAWSVKHDNRLVQNDETISKKVASFEETYNQIETFSSLDLIQRFSATAQGEVAGFGGSVTSSTEAHAHTEVKTNKYDRQKREVVLDTSARICYPGPVYRDDYDTNGQISGRTLVQEGPIWLVDRPIEVIHTVTPDGARGHVGRRHLSRPGELGRQLWAAPGRRALEQAKVRQPQRVAVIHAPGASAAIQVAVTASTSVTRASAGWNG